MFDINIPIPPVRSGNMKWNRPFKDEMGNRYGKLVIIAREPSTNGVKWRCQCDCGNTSVATGMSLRIGDTKSCGVFGCNRKLRTGNGRGYVKLFEPKHPRSDINGYVLEHIVVMEKHIGRYLLPGETVHHIHGNRADNCIEHLELWVKHQPCGQRVSDLVAYAHKIIELYGDIV